MTDFTVEKIDQCQGKAIVPYYLVSDGSRTYQAYNKVDAEVLTDKMNGPAWEPIDTVPMDGTKVLIFSSIDGVNTSYFFGGMWQGLPWRPHDHPAPTHWMPLPEKPVA